VDARGSSEGWLTAVEQAAPWADVILLHAGARDLARMVGPREVSPLLLATLESASLTDAYGSMKLLTQRLGLRVYDLLVGMQDRPRRAAAVGDRLASCADNFLGAVLRSSVAVDRDAPLNTPASDALSRLAAQQLLGLAGAGELAMPAAPRRPSAALTF
jgi:flagellar biosynthesis protein FlhG